MAGQIISEEWRSVVGYEGIYEVSSCGRVRSLSRSFVDTKGRRWPVRGRIKSQSRHKNGYLSVMLNVSGMKDYRPHIHRLVAAAFIGPCPDGMEVNHIDGVKTNNRSKNIQYATKSQNGIHAAENRLLRSGVEHRWSKLTLDEINFIRRSSVSAKVLSIYFSVHQSTIRRIRNNLTYKYD